jgi:hypothetical protein
MRQAPGCRAVAYLLDGLGPPLVKMRKRYTVLAARDIQLKAPTLFWNGDDAGTLVYSIGGATVGEAWIPNQRKFRDQQLDPIGGQFRRLPCC